MMLVRANRAAEETIDEFLKNNEDIDKKTLLDSGYVVEVNQRIAGCFSLEPLGEGRYWLRQLYITRTEAVKLPMLVETILTLALQKKATKVYVKSHKLMLDILLESLQFHPEHDSPLNEKTTDDHGKWWSYQISSP